MRAITFRGLVVIMMAMVAGCLCQAQDDASFAITWKVELKGDLHISVSNRVATTTYFLCGIEQRISGEWREIVLDVSRQRTSKTGMLTPIEPQKKVNFTWQRQRYVEFLSSSEGIFRVKVTPRDRIGTPKGNPVFSEEIKLKK